MDEMAYAEDQVPIGLWLGDGGAGLAGVMPDMTGLRRNGYVCRVRRGAARSAGWGAWAPDPDRRGQGPTHPSPGARRHAAVPGGLGRASRRDPEIARNKLALSANMKRLAEFVAAVLGPGAAA